MHYLLYALTLLISSSLLFVVQPMVAKMVQPVLGGTPAVWNTSMVFFQALLLGGYLYAHLSTRWLGTRKQAIFHLFIMIGGLAFLPVAFGSPTDPTSLANPSLWLLTTLLIGVGWPFFVISTSAPLLQKWFSTIDHPRASDPYHLYAASNIGSVFALLAYPFLIEPRIGLQAQSLLWTIAYLILIASVAVCAAILWKSPPPKEDTTSQAPPQSLTPLTWQRRGRWILWAFIPSSMMLAVTTFITTDIAPVPLLWIPPLAVFLLSFILVFAERKIIPDDVWTGLFPAALIVLFTYFLVDPSLPLWIETTLHFGAFFVFCMTFHGLLAADRPHTDSLTEFYLWMSVGGVLGGAFTALAAPVLFDQLLEYPILVVLAAFFLPPRFYLQRVTALSLLVTFFFATIYSIHKLWDSDAAIFFQILAFVLPLTALIITGLVLRYLPRRINLLLTALAAVICVFFAWPGPDDIHLERSFFAVHTVRSVDDGDYHNLLHGTTEHGIQARFERLEDIPLSYYYPLSPIGDVFNVINQRTTGRAIALVGLGTGCITAYSQADRPWDIFEIDPAVRRIAEDPDLFSFLENCGEYCQITMGDGRLQLAAEEDDIYELIVLDAYTSSAIPVHLLTREAIEIYLDKLHPDGIIAFHISNRHLNLEPPLAQAAHDLGLASRVRMDRIDSDNPFYREEARSSHWLLMAHSEEALRELAFDPEWVTPSPRDDVRTWTDDYANVIGTFRFLSP